MKKLKLITTLLLPGALLTGKATFAQENTGNAQKTEVYKFRSVEINNGDTVEKTMVFDSYSEIPEEIKAKLERAKHGFPERGLLGDRPVRREINREEIRVIAPDGRELTEEEKQRIKMLRERSPEPREGTPGREEKFLMIRKGAEEREWKDIREELHLSPDGSKNHKISILIVESMKEEPNNGKTTNSIESKEMKKEEVKVYPNPASNELSVEFTVRQLPASLSLTNMQGKEISREEIIEKGQFSKKIALPENAGGMYILSITEPNNKISKRVLIEHK